jgi:hypothetical protein
MSARAKMLRAYRRQRGKRCARRSVDAAAADFTTISPFRCPTFYFEPLVFTDFLSDAGLRIAAAADAAAAADEPPRFRCLMPCLTPFHAPPMMPCYIPPLPADFRFTSLSRGAT